MKREEGRYNMKVYRTIQGDTWDIISHKVYGHSFGMEQLIHANLTHIEVSEFPAGILINIPEDDESRIAVNKAPWLK